MKTACNTAVVSAQQGLRGWGWFVAIVLLVLLADQASKWWVINSFMLYESRPVVSGLFHFTFILNTGAAFGILAGAPASWRLYFFVAMTLVALAVLAVLHRRMAAACPAVSIGLAAIAGGALGNLVDRLRLGAVIDFLDFFWQTHHFWTFNLADAAINVGTALVLWCTLWQERRVKGEG